jgi:hypothetical protein
VAKEAAGAFLNTGFTEGPATFSCFSHEACGNAGAIRPVGHERTERVAMRHDKI